MNNKGFQQDKQQWDMKVNTIDEITGSNNKGNVN